MQIETLERRALLSAYLISATGSTAGTGVENPTFITLEEANDRDFAAGDSILFEGGQSFAGGLKLTATDAVGASKSNPLIIGSYGTAGRATINAGAGYGILVENTAGIEISNLNVVGLPKTGTDNFGSSQANAVYSGIEFTNGLTAPAGSASPNVKLEYVNINNVAVSGFGDYGIEIVGTVAKSGFRNVLIEDVVVHNNTHGGIASTGLWDNTSTEYAHENVTVRHANVYRNTGYAGSPNHSGSGIVLADVKNVTIEYSVASYNGQNNTHVGGPVGIWVWDVDNARIHHNESHHNLTNSTADGGGFDFDGGVTNSVMEYNYSHDNAGAGYGIYQFAGARPFYNNHVRYNLSVDDGRKNSYGAIDFWNGNGTNGIKDTHVYNNTVYVSPSVKTTTTTTVNRKGQTVTTTTTTKLGDPRALRFISGTVDVSIYNNIFQTTGGVMLAQIDARQTNLKINGNNWYASGGFALKVLAKTYTSFSAYQAATGHDANGLNVNPEMTPPTVAPTIGYTDITSATQVNSILGVYKPAAAALRNVALAPNWSYLSVSKPATDFFGNPLPEDGTLDIGFYEYVVPTPTPAA